MFDDFNFFKEDIMERIKGDKISMKEFASALGLSVKEAKDVLELKLFNQDILSKLADFFKTSEQYYSNLHKRSVKK